MSFSRKDLGSLNLSSRITHHGSVFAIDLRPNVSGNASLRYARRATGYGLLGMNPSVLFKVLYTWRLRECYDDHPWRSHKIKDDLECGMCRKRYKHIHLRRECEIERPLIEKCPNPQCRARFAERRQLLLFNRRGHSFRDSRGILDDTCSRLRRQDFRLLVVEAGQPHLSLIP